jgi:SAM-dependent methyltransferase
MTTIALDSEQHKIETRTQWDKAAGGWNSHSSEIRQWLQPATHAMIEMAAVRPGHQVLDVAAGAGDQTLDVAARVGPRGNVVATDISDAILAYAKRNAAASGYDNVQVHQADAEDLQLAQSTFDAAICRLGLMFLPNPLAGISEVYRVLKPGASFCSMVFAGPGDNPCIRILMSTALRHAGLPPRDPYQPGGLLSLGKPGAMDDHFKHAGFRNVATTQMDAPFRLNGVQEYLRFVQDSAGPILQILAPLTDAARKDAWEDMRQQLGVFQSRACWEGPNSLLLTVGQR